jgi:shikimate dehydrogenase
MKSGPLLSLGLVGAAIDRSLSPRLHAEALRLAGLDGRYGLWRASDPDAFVEVVDRLRAGEWAGLNVTAPWKQRAADLCDELQPLRMRRRPVTPSSVNTLWLRGGRLLGASTDGSGLVGALHLAGVAWVGRRVLLLGAGGAAWAVAPALLEAGARQLVLAARRRERADALAGWLAGHFGVESAQAVDWGRSAGLGECALVVHATALGHGGSDGGDALDWLPWPSWRRHGTSVADLVYAVALGAEGGNAGEEGKAGEEGNVPLARTWLEQRALDLGLRLDARLLQPRSAYPDIGRPAPAPRGVVLGLGAAMLACQAADSFAWWTGHHPDPWRLLAALIHAPSSNSRPENQ